MSPEKNPPVFSVDASGDTALLRVNGRANYLNCAPLSSLFPRLIEAGKKVIAIDFRDCTGVDSTFLGILAGAALKARRANPPVQVVLFRLNERNLELVQNLGLQRILEIVTDDFDAKAGEGDFKPIEGDAAQARTILEAHRSLIDADKSNEVRFQNVVEFLEKETRE